MLNFLLETQKKGQDQNVNLGTISAQLIVEEMGTNNRQWRKHSEQEESAKHRNPILADARRKWIISEGGMRCKVKNFP